MFENSGLRCDKASFPWLCFGTFNFKVILRDVHFPPVEGANLRPAQSSEELQSLSLLETMATRTPVMPVGNGLRSLWTQTNPFQLSKWYSHFPLVIRSSRALSIFALGMVRFWCKILPVLLRSLRNPVNPASRPTIQYWFAR